MVKSKGEMHCKIRIKTRNMVRFQIYQLKIITRCKYDLKNKLLHQTATGIFNQERYIHTLYVHYYLSNKQKNKIRLLTGLSKCYTMQNYMFWVNKVTFQLCITPDGFSRLLALQGVLKTKTCCHIQCVMKQKLRGQGKNPKLPVSS